MRVDRLLSILLILSNKGLVTGKELADHFEVSLRTIYRDLDKLGEAGIPIASKGGKGGGYYIMENYNLDNLFLDKGEAKTFLSVMNSLDVMFGRNEKFNDIVLKLENAYKKTDSEGDKVNINMSHFSMEKELKEYLYTMSKAIEEDKLLIFYYINRRMEYEKRVVEPIEIEFNNGQWYLTAFCRIRDDYRLFKLVRIKNLKLGTSFEKRQISKEELKKVFDDSYTHNSTLVKLKFTKAIGKQLTEYFHKEDINKIDDGNFIVEASYPNDEGLIKFILGFGKECEVIEPKELRKRTKKYLEMMLGKYLN
ncbi:helix-turn-helix transcriptional regulator [Dethiothermospora halolimnae]|uniref:helix-turn-helix transcriptional regulator n=1 Tax=Dethiothermospora halolimnae TaxID=3114390 RepID=UPI003CCBCD99